MASMVPLSVLDLSPILEGSDAGQSMRNSLDLARHAERLGYRRFWLAEHHNMPGVASAATAVVIGHVAAGTSTIRVGAGGIMLPNHAPLVIAEQFGTLASLFPGRIDLGLGRAPGTDQITARALRRTLAGDVDRFPQDVVELMAYFKPAEPGQMVRAVPGAGLDVPVWILGSSLYSAHLAAKIGRPYAFASHFAPGDLLEALAIYRREFKASATLPEPYVMVGVPAMAADTDEHAEFLATSMYQRSLGIVRGQRAALLPPVESMEGRWSPGEQMAMAERMALMVVGGPARVREGLQQIIAGTEADELIIVSDAYRPEDRCRSFDLIAEAAGLPRTID